MALIVEDGTGNPVAESYISANDADVYFANRAIDTWDNVDDKEAMLRRAADYMTQAYRDRWMGWRTTSTQRLDWPRQNVPQSDLPGGYGPYVQYLATNVVPEAVKFAQAELALIANSGALAPNLGRAKSRVSVPGAVDVTYDPTSPEYTRYRQVDMMLSPYLSGSSVMTPLVRA